MKTNKRLEDLLDLYFDQGLTDETNRELDEIIRTSEEARVRFWQRARLNATLRRHGQEQWGTQWCFNESVEDASEVSSGDAFQRSESVWMTREKAVACVAIAAALLLMIGVSAWSSKWFAAPQIATNVEPAISPEDPAEENNPRGPVQPTPLHWVATLRKAIDVQWSGTGQAPRVGEPLSPGRLSLDSGLIELQTNRGAVVVVEGPGELHVISDMEVRCDRGRIAVNVPPSAHGFLVHTPTVNVIDRGTAFALHVADDDEAEVHVIEGMVELVSPTTNTPVRELREGQAVEVAMTGEYRDIQSSAAAFSTPASANSKARLAALLSRQRWNRRRAAIMNNPDCLVYYDFVPESSNQQTNGQGKSDDIVLVNRAPNPIAGSDGIIVGCDWTEGRWHGKRALGFKNVSDRILFSVPGEYESLSCILTVRIDAINSVANPLLVSRGRKAGHWQWLVTPPKQEDRTADLQWTGSHPFRDAVSKASGGSRFRVSAPVLRREQLGNWIQLGFVWDGVGKTLSQYVNGELVTRDHIATADAGESAMLSLRDMQIGNASATVIEPNMPPGNICGRFDELIVLSRDMSSTEMMAFHRLDRSYWQPVDERTRFFDADNWAVRDAPTTGDNLVISSRGLKRAVYDENTTDNFAGVQVGTLAGSRTELEIAGGTLIADHDSNYISRVGVGGGDGALEQTSGSARFNALQIGLDSESSGVYRLIGGTLIVSRTTLGSGWSLEVGVNKGTGTFEVSGGAFETRCGVMLGNQDGVGTFRVVGDRAEQIAIGSNEDRDGRWLQHEGSTLDIRVGANGVTPIWIEEVGSDGGGDVIFQRGAVLHVDFLNEPVSGHWDVMKWEGQLFDNGLVFAPTVDQEVWSFEFVDTDDSGTPDTLRVTAMPR
ncbi:FecR domain-containing protein [Rhodopirellula sallentina]|uniref:FecR protein domain protein n=1 Tax=Rhodopirellula sallentina SM41 TaxID=1263870 RepID=M5U2P7_9BACT|nr:FecR domain-containing protein [Rhodopirellula sallentina]EMI55559.1 FecR protein domain protein [Rhodopirellula sallentina SM41]